ncbi:MAG: hypothetical protein C7B45_10620 [Sulfobacillus acidophilus]|uniref:Holin n=1 Tax=Sulfobacillus acidophilus TaxID=53633 RepID=A0A2T2WGW2_9FIRM|nr:MAG: hypothetical protein C7B45_10620 [Sulfobacillus acidophilus]
MLTLANFGTVAGATAITLAIVKLLTAVWPKVPHMWAVWAAAECTMFVDGLMTGPWTITKAVELFFSGMVVAATALGSTTGGQRIAESITATRRAKLPDSPPHSGSN